MFDSIYHLVPNNHKPRELHFQGSHQATHFWTKAFWYLGFVWCSLAAVCVWGYFPMTLQCRSQTAEQNVSHTHRSSGVRWSFLQLRRVSSQSRTQSVWSSAWSSWSCPDSRLLFLSLTFQTELRAGSALIFFFCIRLYPCFVGVRRLHLQILSFSTSCDKSKDLLRSGFHRPNHESQVLIKTSLEGVHLIFMKSWFFFYLYKVKMH